MDNNKRADVANMIQVKNLYRSVLRGKSRKRRQEITQAWVDSLSGPAAAEVTRHIDYLALHVRNMGEISAREAVFVLYEYLAHVQQYGRRARTGPRLSEYNTPD